MTDAPGFAPNASNDVVPPSATKVTVEGAFPAGLKEGFNLGSDLQRGASAPLNTLGGAASPGGDPREGAFMSRMNSAIGLPGLIGGDIAGRRPLPLGPFATIADMETFLKNHYDAQAVGRGNWGDSDVQARPAADAAVAQARPLDLSDAELVAVREFSVDFAIRRNHGQATDALIAEARAIADFVLQPRT